MKRRLFLLFSLFVGLGLFPGQNALAQFETLPSATEIAPTQETPWNVEYVTEIEGNAQAVVVQGSYAYAVIDQRLVVLNIAVPESPVVVGQTEVFPTITHNLTVSGTRAYLASDTAGMRIIDTSTPASPVQIGVCDTPGRARSVAISGDYAFVADETGHFQVCDISTPSTSAVVGAYPYLYSTYGVAISRNYAYVGANEFVVFDISTPTTPQRIGSYQPGSPEGYAHEAIVVRDGVAFVGESMITSPPYVGGGVRILDVATPEFPRSRNFYDTPGTTKGLVLEGKLLYIADGSGGLRIIDVSDPLILMEAGLYAPSGLFVTDVAVSGNYIFIAAALGGMKILRYTGNCAVPYFSQRDPQWIDHPLRTTGSCSADCDTIGKCGCALTSSAMLFGYYGADVTPASLSDCMGNEACPYYWRIGAACTLGKAQWGGKASFTWERLDLELNQNHRSVLLGMRKENNTHWLVVLNGNGTDPTNYTVHDPWPLHGSHMNLDVYSSLGWNFEWLAFYTGQPSCSNARATTATPSRAVPFVDPAKAMISAIPGDSNEWPTLSETQSVTASANITASVLLYRMTALTMTVQLNAISDQLMYPPAEVLLWTDTMTQTAWQSTYPGKLVVLPVSEVIYARFCCDSEDNESEIISDTLHPKFTPPTMLFKVFLPVLLRQ